MPWLETLDLWVEEPSELAKLKAERGCDEKDDSVPEKMTPGQHFTERSL